MKANKKHTFNLLSTVFLVVLFVSCSKERIENKEMSNPSSSEKVYMGKLEVLTASNNAKVQKLGINFSGFTDTIRQKFRSYQEAYEFISSLKKGISSVRVDSTVVKNSSNKLISTMAAGSGVETVAYTVNCSNAASISGTWGTGTITGTWVVTGNLGYSYIQNSSTSPRVYKSVMPIGTDLSTPFLAYSGVGTLTASAGGWNGSAASYTMQRTAQVLYTITVGGTSTNGSVALKINFASGISWTPSPQTVYVTHSMSAQAY